MKWGGGVEGEVRARVLELELELELVLVLMQVSPIYMVCAERTNE